MVRPRLLGFLLGGFGGTMKAGVGGAEKACPLRPEDAFEGATFGSCAPCRFDANVFTDKFFILRIFLFGDSARSRPGKDGNEFENVFLLSIILCAAGVELVLRVLKEERGNIEVGESGEELGDGSVSEDSIVDMVVVGEDSTDSNVEVESRRNVCEEKLLALFGLFAEFVVLPGDWVVVVIVSLACCESGPSPNTDMKEGRDARSD